LSLEGALPFLPIYAVLAETHRSNFGPCALYRMDKGVIVFDRSTSKPIATLKGHTKKVTSVLASTTETEAGLPSFVVSASLDKSVRVWTPNGKKTAYECSTNLSLGAEVNALALHPSNSLVVAALADGSWVVIDVQAPESASVILTGGLPSGTAEGTANTAAAFHPDGGMFGLGSSDAKIRVYEISTAKCAAEFEGHPGAAHGVSSLSFSENGYTLASAAQGSNQVKIWDLRKLSNSANIDVEGATAVAFDPSAQFLAVVGTDARVYAYKSWELLVQNDDNSAELTSAAWGPDAHELVVAGLDRSVRVLTRAEASA
jgi:pre-mRNA-processing factor 19